MDWPSFIFGVFIGAALLYFLISDYRKTLDPKKKVMHQVKCDICTHVFQASVNNKVPKCPNCGLYSPVEPISEEEI